MSLNHDQLKAWLQEERRQTHFPGFTREESGYLVRHVSNQPEVAGRISWWDIPSRELEAVVEGEKSVFAERESRLDWRVYSHDRPMGCEIALKQAGFYAGPMQSWWVMPVVDGQAAAELPAGLSLKRLVDKPSLKQLRPLLKAVWGQEQAMQTFHHLCFLQAQAADYLDVFAVVHDENQQAVACGWNFFPEVSPFSHLQGGTTLSAWRSQGLYRFLLAQRMLAAQARGKTHLSLWARPESEPLIQKNGFTKISECQVWTWIV